MKSNPYSFEVDNEPDLFFRNGLRSTTGGLSDHENEFGKYETAIRIPLPAAPFPGRLMPFHLENSVLHEVAIAKVGLNVTKFTNVFPEMVATESPIFPI